MVLRYIFYLLTYILIISILSIYIIIKWIRFSSYLGKIYKLQELSKALRIVPPFSIFQSTSNLPAHHSTFPKFPQKRPPTNKRIHQQINEIKFTVATIDCYELTYQKTLQLPPNFLALSPRARKKKQKKRKKKLVPSSNYRNGERGIRSDVSSSRFLRGGPRLSYVADPLLPVKTGREKFCLVCGV